ncbi:MAG: hypothetical protein OXR84_03470, partial [Magnetovibrio sp.]|nr:hypothetical protein [Magnetovibrio sp.]
MDARIKSGHDEGKMGATKPSAIGMDRQGNRACWELRDILRRRSHNTLMLGLSTDCQATSQRETDSQRNIMSL